MGSFVLLGCIVLVIYLLKHLPKQKCVSCGGAGFSSSGITCSTCGGTGII